MAPDLYDMLVDLRILREVAGLTGPTKGSCSLLSKEVGRQYFRVTDK